MKFFRLLLLAFFFSLQLSQSQRTDAPTQKPTQSPTKSPTERPTELPTKNPTTIPTGNPTLSPTTETPTSSPTLSPSSSPTTSPTKAPTKNPTTSPTKAPTKNPTTSPTKAPTQNPTQSPTFTPTSSPTQLPTESPTFTPTFAPTSFPTSSPVDCPEVCIERICPAKATASEALADHPVLIGAFIIFFLAGTALGFLVHKNSNKKIPLYQLSITRDDDDDDDQPDMSQLVTLVLPDRPSSGQRPVSNEEGNARVTLADFHRRPNSNNEDDGSAPNIGAIGPQHSGGRVRFSKLFARKEGQGKSEEDKKLNSVRLSQFWSKLAMPFANSSASPGSSAPRRPRKASNQMSEPEV